MKSYDIIIDSSSLYSDWSITYNRKKEEITKLLKTKFAVVAAYGSVNKGKF